MGPKKAGANKRKSAADAEREMDDIQEVEGEKRRKNRGNEKYIGAHVRIQGGVSTLHHLTIKTSHAVSHFVLFRVIQVGFGKPCTPPWRWVETALPCFWDLSGHGSEPPCSRRPQRSSGSSVRCRGSTRLTSCPTGPTWWTVDLPKRVCSNTDGCFPAVPRPWVPGCVDIWLQLSLLPAAAVFPSVFSFRCLPEEPRPVGRWAQPMQPAGSQPLQLPPWIVVGLHHRRSVLWEDSRGH